MNEYWNSISDTCYFLKKNQNSSAIKSFNGQKFYKIPDDVKQSIIKRYIIDNETKYFK